MTRLNERNPTPGTIINKPNGTDVYQGVVIDYKGKVRNFLTCTNTNTFPINNGDTMCILINALW